MRWFEEEVPLPYVPEFVKAREENQGAKEVRQYTVPWSALIFHGWRSRSKVQAYRQTGQALQAL